MPPLEEAADAARAAEMVAAGRERGLDPAIAWSVGDAQRLPLRDASADAYVIAFGIRNVTDIPTALREARRVLKPGGRFAVEIGYDQKQAVEDLFRQAGASGVRTLQDLGTRDRVVVGEKNALERPL